MTVDKNRSPGTPAGAGAIDVQLFVDAIEGERVRLLLGEEAFEVPARLLPEGAKEGSWVSVSLALAPAPPDDADAIRRQLSGDDDGGVIKL
jgi:hypothetical protein